MFDGLDVYEVGGVGKGCSVDEDCAPGTAVGATELFLLKENRLGLEIKLRKPDKVGEVGLLSD